MSSEHADDRSQEAAPETPEAGAESAASAAEAPLPVLAVRAVVGGVLMGLANLVPGISGGTMLLASGVYPQFIGGIAEVSTFKFKKRSLVVLGLVVLFAVAAIGLFAGPVRNLVVEHRWVMFSLFIGLTLGGVPLVWSMVKPADGAVWRGAILGFVPMVAIAVMQMFDPNAAETEGFVWMFIAGMAGASAMILPGVSGGYLLLVMGAYVPILGGIHALKEALKARDIDAIWAPALEVVIPVGLGVVVGVLVVSNGLKVLLDRYEKTTLGALLGLLVGAVAGLWPFREGVAPALGTVFKGQEVTAELLAELPAHKYPTEFFTPSVTQVLMALGLVALGFGATALIARFGGSESGSESA